MDAIHSIALTIHTLFSEVKAPIPKRGNQPADPGDGPLHSGVETGRPPKPRSRQGQDIARIRMTPAWTPTPSTTPTTNYPRPHQETGPKKPQPSHNNCYGIIWSL
ncbi:hypothetical protein CRENBAI_004093 [Crenichthys baileyi]|uniref:Uncharacterized protein n=1 Tax=Crenichthys baileyi TaxID=28760 RepID=A0AAV9SCP7_9TELE